jgi:RNA polymerase sigma-70 factor (ECF subfamily)
MLHSELQDETVTRPPNAPDRPSRPPRHDPSKKILEELYRAHSGQLRGFARRRVGAHEAEDLVQDVYLRLLQKDSIAGLERPREYLFRVASNLAIDSARKMRTRSRVSDEDLGLVISPERMTSPEEIVESRKALQRLQTSLDELPPMSRKVLLLNRLGDVTHEELADRMGVSVRTVERRMAKALKQLRRRLALGAA